MIEKVSSTDLIHFYLSRNLNWVPWSTVAVAAVQFSMATKWQTIAI